MATAASRYALSASSGTLLSPQAPCQQKSCSAQRRVIIRCNAAQKRAQLAKTGSAAASRRSLLTAGLALPFSVLLVDKAGAFVEEEGITESERQRRELVQAIQERAAREKARLEAAAAEAKEAAEAAGAQAVETVEDAGTAVKTQIEEAAPKVESKIEEVAPKVESKIEEAAPKVESKIEEVAPKVETKIEDAAPKVEKVAEEAPKATAPVESVPSQVEQAAEAVSTKVEAAAEAVTTKVEAAAESVRNKVQEVVASEAGGSASKVEAPAPELPKYGPGSAERIREANIRRPTRAEKYSGNPDDVNPSDPIYQRMDSSKMPDLPYLFPKENYGTPWVPPADAPADKIKPFFGPWDIGAQPEKAITRPFIDRTPQKDGDVDRGVASIYLAIINLVVVGGYLVAKQAQKGELDTLLPLLEETREEESDKEEKGPVQQMKAEKAAFDAAEAERIARGEGGEESAASNENTH